MIMFYDILLLDGIVCGLRPHDERRQLLQSLVHSIPGRAGIGTRQVIDFSCVDAEEQLRLAFARAITHRWEGFVLKGCESPYFSLSKRMSFIKLKKDYIPGLGDTTDLAIIGGSRDMRDEIEIGHGKLWWTSFYIACVQNKDEVLRFGAKPIFRIMDVINRYAISKENIKYLNRHGYFMQTSFATSAVEFSIYVNDARRTQPTELFRRPFVVEVVGAGFDKPANTGYYTLRFPRVLKIHHDRSPTDAVSFNQLQKMAQSSLEVSKDREPEEQNWCVRLLGSDGSFESLRTGYSSESEVSGVDVPSHEQSNQQEVLGLVSAPKHVDDVCYASSKGKRPQEVVLGGTIATKRAKKHRQ